MNEGGQMEANLPRFKSYKAIELPDAAFEPLQFTRYPLANMFERGRSFYDELNQRRTTRHFSSEPVPRELIELAILSAGTAPSGAHRQPWRFVAIDDPELKRQIRLAAEEEELKTYSERMSDEWRRALAPLGTDHIKEHITDAPWVVVLFKESYELLPDGTKVKNYYVDESVGICAGMFITAIHHMGLSTLTHTPTPMAFLGELLGRPKNEHATLLMPVGYPAANAQVPCLQRKTLAQIVQWNRSEATRYGND
jgi:iodotyrosine deiodinase